MKSVSICWANYVTPHKRGFKGSNLERNWIKVRCSFYVSSFSSPRDKSFFFFPLLFPRLCASLKRAAALPRFKKVKVSDKSSLYYWLCWEIITLEGIATLHAHDNCTNNNMKDHSSIKKNTNFSKKTYCFNMAFYFMQVLIKSFVGNI